MPNLVFSDSPIKMEYKHTPVMLSEVLKYLNPQNGGYFIDCTLGGSGYTLAIAKKIAPKGKILSIDLDDLAIKNAKLKIKNAKLDNIILVQDNFKNLSDIVKKKWKINNKFNGIVLDLGLSKNAPIFPAPIIKTLYLGFIFKNFILYFSNLPIFFIIYILHFRFRNFHWGCMS